MTKYEDLCTQVKQQLGMIAGNFIYLNCKENEDGSIGEVKISPAQLRQALADAYLEGYSDH